MIVIAPNALHYCDCCCNEHHKDFFPGWPIVNFSYGRHKELSMEAKGGEISFSTRK